MNIENIGFSIFFIAILISFYYYDRILKTEYSGHYDQWLKDGSPIGFFWVPKGAKLIAGSFARGTLSFQWVMRNPDWAKNDPAVVRYLYKMRISGAVGVAAWLIIVMSFLTRL
jgi:hypothetical protein